MEDRLKPLLADLKNAIRDTLAESKKIMDAIEEVEHVGYDVFIMLDAALGFIKEDGTEEEKSILKSGKRKSLSTLPTRTMNDSLPKAVPISIGTAVLFVKKSLSKNPLIEPFLGDL